MKALLANIGHFNFLVYHEVRSVNNFRNQIRKTFLQKLVKEYNGSGCCEMKTDLTRNVRCPESHLWRMVGYSKNSEMKISSRENIHFGCSQDIPNEYLNVFALFE